MARLTQKRRDAVMPPAIWIIGFGIFAQGTSELMLAGLLPELSADLGVTIPQAGGLISAFALGMLIGAPVLAMLTLRGPFDTWNATRILAEVTGSLAIPALAGFCRRATNGKKVIGDLPR